MFWGIIITSGLATFFGSRGILLASILVAVIFLCTQKKYISLCWYLGGVFLSCGSLLYLLFFQPIISSTLPSDIVVCIETQRSEDTRIAMYNKQKIYIRSDKALVVGSCVRAYIKREYVPPFTLSWIGRQIPSFLTTDTKKQFTDWLRMKGYVAAGTLLKGQVYTVGSFQLGTLQQRKERFKTYVYKVWGPKPIAALVLGLTTGDRSGFSRQQYTSFVDSGLSHLVAVSGSNLLYVSFFLGAVLFRMPFYIRVVVVTTGILIYALLCGADSSVVRAIGMSMGGLVMTGVGRPAPPWFWIKVVCAFMIIQNPLLIWYDLGFILSFSAVVGIHLRTTCLTTYTHRHCYKQYSHVLTNRLLPTCGATWGVCSPLVLWVGKFSLSSFWINVIIAPCIPIFLLLNVWYMVWGGSLLKTVLLWGVDLLFSRALRLQQYGSFLILDTPVLRFIFLMTYICGSYIFFSLFISHKNKKEC